VDRKTVRRFMDAGIEAGLVREGGEGLLTDALVGVVIEAVRPERPSRARPDRDVAEQGPEADQGRRSARPSRRGGPVADLHRYAAEQLGIGGRGTTVPVVDGEPGQELQVDFCGSAFGATNGAIGTSRGLLSAVSPDWPKRASIPFRVGEQVPAGSEELLSPVGGGRPSVGHPRCTRYR
jgi:hypothetical protein